jgi:hypothetical protein
VPADRVPDPIAALDQALAGMPNMARILRAYYDALIAQGFTEHQATALTKGYQRTLAEQTLPTP